MKRAFRSGGLLLFGLSLAWACGFDDALREYLDAHFWLPFSHSPALFAKKNVRRSSVPYAGMVEARSQTPLDRLRAAYQKIAKPDAPDFDPELLRQSVISARAQQPLTAREREEIDLIDAKIDMRDGDAATRPESLRGAQKKFQQFLRTARTPEYLSEARGWLAHIHFLFGEQTEAGKIYLDELNRDGSNLSRETLLNSLRMNYGYDGGPNLLAHLEDYFDTPEHAAFAIQMVTNPHWSQSTRWNKSNWSYREGPERIDNVANSYTRVSRLLEKHRDLLHTNNGANALSLLTMRTALRMGDPPGALKFAESIPATAAIRAEPDFQWMLASARFLSHDFAAAEQPILDLFRSSQASSDQKAAAAYGLCGVYQKTGNTVEQLRFALWLKTAVRKADMYLTYGGGVADKTIYWAVSGWDLGLLLDIEAPIEQIEAFLAKYGDSPDTRIVKYSLAVRLARENRYEEAAHIYESIHANRRAPRMRRLAALYQEANRNDLAPPELQEAKFRLAEFIGSNSNGIYYNDALWGGLQRYAMFASNESRVTRQERQTLLTNERKLKDDQEERWRAYLILRDVVDHSGKSEVGRKAAKLAIRYVRSFSDRFGREGDIRKADIELSTWLK